MCDVCNAAPDWFGGEEPAEATLAVERKPRRRVDRAPAPVDTPYDPALLEYLREWRREVAGREGVPAFMVAHDSVLEDLCRKRPRTREDLLHVSGIGERKAAAYGSEILIALEAFGKGARAGKREEPKASPAEETMRVLGEGRTFEEIAQIRERRVATVIDLVAELVERGRLAFNEKWIDPERRRRIEAALSQQQGAGRFKAIKDALPAEITYGEIRLVAAKLKHAAGSLPGDAGSGGLTTNNPVV